MPDTDGFVVYTLAQLIHDSVERMTELVARAEAAVARCEQIEETR